jgi:hypothetical protein
MADSRVLRSTPGAAEEEALARHFRESEAAKEAGFEREITVKLAIASVYDF